MMTILTTSYLICQQSRSPTPTFVTPSVRHTGCELDLISHKTIRGIAMFQRSAAQHSTH